MALFGSDADIARLQRQIDDQQQLIDHLYAQLGLPKPTMGNDVLAQRARQLKDAGKPIEAIKLVRAETGRGLKDAKDYVDGL